jgi:hypothetical protein
MDAGNGALLKDVFDWLTERMAKSSKPDFTMHTSRDMC